MAGNFKTIPDYPNYSVNPDGVIRHDKTGKTLSHVDNGKGYKVVKLFNGKRPQGRLCLVHRVVLSTFVPSHSTGLDVNHKNGDKGCNLLCNLEWVTKSENTQHAHITGLFKNKLSIEQVKEIKALLSEVERDTQVNIGKKYGVVHSIIGKIWRGELYDYV